MSNKYKNNILKRILCIHRQMIMKRIIIKEIITKEMREELRKSLEEMKRDSIGPKITQEERDKQFELQIKLIDDEIKLIAAVLKDFQLQPFHEFEIPYDYTPYHPYYGFNTSDEDKDKEKHYLRYHESGQENVSESINYVIYDKTYECLLDKPLILLDQFIKLEAHPYLIDFTKDYLKNNLDCLVRELINEVKYR